MRLPRSRRAPAPDRSASAQAAALVDRAARAADRSALENERGPVAFFVRRFVFAAAIFLAVALFGFSQVPRVGVDLLPEFDVPVVAVSTAYTGASPAQVSRLVSEPIEDGLASVEGVTQLSSVNREGFSQVIVQFQFGRDLDALSVEVSQRVSALRGALPDGVGTPVVQRFDPSQQPILAVAVQGEGVSLEQAAAVARDVLQPALQRVPGVADVSLDGAPDEQLQVLLDPEALVRFGLGPPQVAGLIGGAVANVSLGTLTEGGVRSAYTLRAEPRSAAELEALVIDPARGLRLGDVAEVRRASAEARTLARLNGQEAVSVSVQKVPGSNAVAVAADVRAALDGLALPDGYRVAVVNDTTEYIAASVEDTWREVLLTVVAVSLVTLLFLGRLSTAFAVVLAIPISLAGGLVLLGLMGYTFNIITLLAVIVAVGIVVDDSIVVAENAERYREQGLGPVASVLRGTREVLSAVTASTLSLLAVFLPISFLPGIIGQFFAQFGLVLAAAIALSWAEALFFLTVRMAYTPHTTPLAWDGVPARLRGGPDWGAWRSPVFWLGLAVAAGLLHWRGGVSALPWLALYPLLYPLAAWWLRAVFAAFEAAVTAVFRVGERGLSALTRAYVGALDRALRLPWLVLGLAGLLLASSALVFPRLPFNFIPRSDSGLVELTLELPAGTATAEIDRLSRRLEAALLAQPVVDTVQTQVGPSGFSSAQNRATLSVTLIEASRRADSDAVGGQLLPVLQGVIADRPEAELRSSAVQLGPGGGTDLSLLLLAPDLATLEDRNARMVEIAAAMPELVNVRSNVSERFTEQGFVPDPAALQGTGIATGDLAAAIATYAGGRTAARLELAGGRELPVVVRARPEDLASQEALLSLPIHAPALGQSLPLRALGAFEARAAPTTVSRTDRQFSATLLADLAPGAPGLFVVQGELERRLADAGVTGGGVTVGTSGVGELLGDLQTSGPVAFGLALLLNYLVIASQFNTFRYPLYILLTVPLALIGAFWAALLFGTGLDVVSVLGVVLLIGLVTKNAILLLDFVLQTPELPLRDALLRAASLRLRPILMTTATLLVITLPLLLGLGDGSEFRRPLGVITLGGVATGTLLTLFVIPAAFFVFERRRHAAERERLARSGPPAPG